LVITGDFALWPVSSDSLDDAEVSDDGSGSREPRAKAVCWWSQIFSHMLLGITRRSPLNSGFSAFLGPATCCGLAWPSTPREISFHCGRGSAFRAINAFSRSNRASIAIGRTARFYAAMLRNLFRLQCDRFARGCWRSRMLLPPSAVLGFSATSHFDAARSSA